MNHDPLIAELYALKILVGALLREKFAPAPFEGAALAKDMLGFTMNSIAAFELRDTTAEIVEATRAAMAERAENLLMAALHASQQKDILGGTS